MRNTALVQLLHDTAQDDLQNIIRRKRLVAAHGRRVHDIPCLGDLVQLIVEVLERIANRRVVAQLQQLDAQLMRGRLQLIQRLGRLDKRGLDVVVKLARGKHNQIPPRKLAVLLDLVGVPAEQLGQTRTQVALPLGFDMGEDLGDAVTRLKLREPADAAVPRFADGLTGQELDEALGAVVDKVDVDAVRVVLGAHGGDVVDELLDLLPVRGHGRAVVDDEDRLEGAQVGQLGIVLAGVDAASAGAWEVGGHFDWDVLGEDAMRQKDGEMG